MIEIHKLGSELPFNLLNGYKILVVKIHESYLPLLSHLQNLMDVIKVVSQLLIPEEVESFVELRIHCFEAVLMNVSHLLYRQDVI